MAAERWRREEYRKAILHPRADQICRGTSSSQPTISFVPKHRQRSSKKVPNDPIITFRLEAFSGALKGEITVPQSTFLAETRTKIPQVLDFDEGDKIEYNFRALLDVSRGVKVDAEWEAFSYFVQWLHTGVYENFQMEGTHIDAYILSKTIGAPRFGNAVMEVILATMPGRKYDQDLTERFRQIFLSCEVNSPLRTLYFESAVYWKMSYGRNDRIFEDFATRGDGVLTLDEVEDEVLIEVLKKHRDEFCLCANHEFEGRAAEARKMSKSHEGKKGKVEGLEHRNRDSMCICRVAPWSRDRERFFIAT